MQLCMLGSNVKRHRALSHISTAQPQRSGLIKCCAGGWDRKEWQRWGRLTTKMPVNNGFRANNQLDIPVGLFGLFRAFRKSSTHVLRFFPTHTHHAQHLHLPQHSVTRTNTVAMPKVMSSTEKGKEGLCILSVLKVRTLLLCRANYRVCDGCVTARAPAAAAQSRTKEILFDGVK